MRPNKIQFIKDSSIGLEIVILENSDKTYQAHTHTSHSVVGIITNGAILITVGDKEYYCKAGEYFSVAPDVCHTIKPLTETYSMTTICIPSGAREAKSLDIVRNKILGNPEQEFKIADISQQVYVSTYHLIRKFSVENGITPHQFQLQCKIRKAQLFLAEGMKVIDVAYMLGFCDQSHLDREFKKHVGISPEEYSRAFLNSAILSKL